MPSANGPRAELIRHLREKKGKSSNIEGSEVANYLALTLHKAIFMMLSERSMPKQERQVKALSRPRALTFLLLVGAIGCSSSQIARSLADDGDDSRWTISD